MLIFNLAFVCSYACSEIRCGAKVGAGTLGGLLGVVHERRKAREREWSGLEGGGDNNGVVEEEVEGEFGYEDVAVVTFTRSYSCFSSCGMRISL